VRTVKPREVRRVKVRMRVSERVGAGAGSARKYKGRSEKRGSPPFSSFLYGSMVVPC